MKVNIILAITISFLFLSCEENSDPISPSTLKPKFVVDTLDIIANPDSVQAKLVYHFEGLPGYIGSFLVEVYYSGHILSYGINPNYPIDTVGQYYTKYNQFSLYYTPAIGFTTYAKCVITGSYVNVTETGWSEFERFTWSDSSSIVISQ